MHLTYWCANTRAVIEMAYGIIVGVSCLIALGAIANVYQYANLQNQVGIYTASYSGIVRLEEFQLGPAQNLSILAYATKLDNVWLSTTNGISVATAGEYSSISLISSPQTSP